MNLNTLELAFLKSQMEQCIEENPHDHELQDYATTVLSEIEVEIEKKETQLLA